MTEIDYTLLEREFDRTKTKVFLNSNAAFLGPLMCSMNFSWVEDIQTACTNGVTLWWNPRFFLSLLPEVRETILLHELWHPARLDMLRCGSREHEIWNYAADILINNTLIREGKSFKGFKPWFNFDYEGWVTEDVYDDIVRIRDELIAKHQAQGQGNAPAMPWSTPWLTNPETGLGDLVGDLVEPDEVDVAAALQHQVLNNVISAAHQAQLAGGSIPGEIETTLKRFLAPKIDWDKALFQFFNELGGHDYSWARPNRRYQDMYLPDLMEEYNGLDHVIYYEDVSGSISDGDAIRFNSEFKYVHDYFKPKKMTMVQFDEQIQKEDVFLEEDEVDEVKIVGRGGTSLVCVREHIIEHKPTAVVIFSDLQCDPMHPLPADLAHVPIIWVALNNRKAEVPHGTIVHLHE
jgi:predicted metal-dependent peptidase